MADHDENNMTQGDAGGSSESGAASDRDRDRDNADKGDDSDSAGEDISKEGMHPV